MENKIGEIEYDGIKYYIINNDEISSSDHCKYCDFSDNCEFYINNYNWFACGAVFQANKVYLKKE